MSTPLMKQYSRMKAQYPDTVLLFRLGDFYETFEEDARTASRVLGITLTRRGNGGASETPLAGFPHHALEQYMPKLLRAGLKVAVCEQMEDPKLAKGLVKREVTEVVTPGASFSESILLGNRNNYLLAVALPTSICARNDLVGMAYADVTTGEFRAAEVPLGDLSRHVSALSPAETLVQQRDRETLAPLLSSPAGGVLTGLEDWIFTAEHTRELLLDHFGTKTLKGFGLGEMSVGVVAAGSLLHYLRENQKSNLPHMRKITPLDASGFMTLDGSTRRNLEIVRSSSGGEEGTLFSVIDRTRTPMGGRLMKEWINRPLRAPGPINERLDVVAELVGTSGLLADVRGILDGIGDLERLTARICTGRATPRETASLAGMLGAVGKLRSVVPPGAAAPRVSVLAAGLPDFTGLVGSVRRTLADDPPQTLATGGVVRPGVDPALDGLRAAAHDGKAWIAGLQQTERGRTGIPSLKVGFNNVFGYYIEITNAHRDKVPPEYTRKQTLTGAERYVTPELKEFEEKILNAEERILALETRIFNDLRTEIAAAAADLQGAAASVAAIDCLASFAAVAASLGYVRPELDEGEEIVIRGGRHPVIETLLPPGESYTPNDTVLDAASGRVQIITGPNMSGKSSFLRQTALIVLLAQVGSYVPAASARIGVVDAIFTRVGASDNIASGESTFLVEMHEAANIVNTATPRSLILLDEVGRGTSTFDGISIAWALTEYIHDVIGAKTLFATHYHELNEMAELFPGIRNLKVDVREYGSKVIFLHKVTPGFADHSYGIQVGRMAGLPEEVTRRAAEILKNLEGSELLLHTGAGAAGRAAPGAGGRHAGSQMTLFTEADRELREKISGIDPDNTTPMEALRILSELKKHVTS
jgi:DNA mismatch repair protein MutS